MNDSIFALIETHFGDEHSFLLFLQELATVHSSVPNLTVGFGI